MELKKVINERHSVRKFKSKKPDWRKIIEACDAANRAPLAGNIQTLRFILVSDPEKISELAEAAGQEFIKQAQYVVVVCSDKKQAERRYGERAERYCRQQAGAAIENFLLRITDLGLASCWVGAFFDEQIKRIIQAPENIDIEAILPVGFEYGKGKSRRKLSLDSFLWFDIWKNKYMKPKIKPEA